MAEGKFEPFNLETMSGVFPGSRTAQFERVRLRPTEEPDTELRWARLLWVDDPRSCVVYLQTRTSRNEEPLLRLQVTDPSQLIAELRTLLSQAGFGLEACGTCRNWRPTTGVDADHLPSGHCIWQQDGATPSELSLATIQSGLALNCPHWMEADEPQPPCEIDGVQASLPRAAVEKKAEEAADSFWGRIRARFRSQGEETPATSPVRLIEQSGVGAGTEPCLACEGRIANLGAHRSKTGEGDQQTFSIWRCRLCQTYYLNHWIDRWVRLDTLETVESYYRIAPAEAAVLLGGIEHDTGDEHFTPLLASRLPLSTQVKQGR